MIPDDAEKNRVALTLESHPILKVHSGFPNISGPFHLFDLQRGMIGILGQTADLTESFTSDGRGKLAIQLSETVVGVDSHLPSAFASPFMLPSPRIRPLFLSFSTARSIACHFLVQK